MTTGQRIHPDNFVDILVSALHRSGIDEFRRFLEKYPSVTGWHIASDFVINEPQATSDAYAYTFFPANSEMDKIKSKIARLAPKDFKKTRTIKAEFREFFHSGETFTICLLTPKKYRIAGDIHSVRRVLDETLRMMRSWEDAADQTEIIGLFERLRERANANNFSARLISTMIIATVMAAFCAILLTQERKIEAVGWYPDRDNIKSAYDRIAEWMFTVNFSAFRQRHGIDERNTKTLIGHPEPDAANPKQSWYDELVRIPDFIAGSLAAWDYRSNLVPGRPKYAEILQGIVADNRYVTNLLLVDTDEGIGIGRLSCSIRPPADVE